jgi:uncharacterized membrane protein/uncharacterized protein YwbE
MVMNKEAATNQSATNRIWRKWIGGAAVGAMAMYLSDPERGRRRRALARDKMQSLAAKTGDAIDVASRDFANRMQGVRAQASRILKQRSYVTDDQLVAERVRAKLGHAVSHPHAIKVMVQQGRVTLTGPILANEKEQLLEAVRAVPGVVEVNDETEVHERPDIPSLQGEGRRRQLRSTLMQETWPPALRAAAALGGGALGIYGLRRRSPANALLAAIGLGLMARGMMNMPLTRMLGIAPRTAADRQAIHLQKTIYIAAPPETVFDLWSNYENFPHFMSNVQKVRDLGNGRSHWIVNGPAGTQVEWDAVLTESRRPEILAWKSEPASPVQHTGRVRFEPADDGTRVNVEMSYSPPAGILGHALASLFNGSPKKQLDEDLLRMKTFIERGVPPHDAAKPGAVRPDTAPPVQKPTSILH